MQATLFLNRNSGCRNLLSAARLFYFFPTKNHEANKSQHINYTKSETNMEVTGNEKNAVQLLREKLSCYLKGEKSINQDERLELLKLLVLLKKDSRQAHLSANLKLEEIKKKMKESDLLFAIAQRSLDEKVRIKKKSKQTRKLTARK